MEKQNSQASHAMIAMIDWYNKFRDFASRDQENQTYRVCAFDAASFAIKQCEEAGFCPMSLITDAYNYAAKYNFDRDKAAA